MIRHRSFLILLCCFGIAFSQVFNTGQTISRRKFNISLAPIVLVSSENNLGLYSQFGIGVARSIDIGFNLRIAQEESPVFGADIEFALLRNTPALSLTGGAHVFRNGVGIDAAINLTFVIRKIVSLYGGLNFDVDFHGEDDTHLPLWGFFGIDVMVRRNLGFILEVDLDVLDDPRTPHIFGAGISVYF